MRSMLLALMLAVVLVPTAFAGDGPGAALDVDHKPFDMLLKKHVKKGLVDYAGLQADRAALGAYLKTLAKADPGEMARNAKMAFYINAYNACTLEGVLATLPADRATWAAYSVTKVPGFWKKTTYVVGGQPLTLDTIEHKILRPRFEDPRIHFAVNCASAGCPVLRAEAFFPDRLSKQLDEQARLFVNDTTRNQIDPARRELRLSKIFEWFKGDFTQHTGTLQAFVGRYVSDPKLAEALGKPGWTVKHLEYGWSLNLHR